MKDTKNVEEKLPKIDGVTNYILKKGSLVTYIVKTVNDGSGIVIDTLTRDLTFSESWLKETVDSTIPDRENFYFFDHVNPDIIELGINSEDVEIEKISRKEYEKNLEEDKQTNHWFNYFQEMNSLGVS